MLKNSLLICVALLLSGLLRAQSSIAVSPIVGASTIVPLQSTTSLSGMAADSNGKPFDLGYVTAGGYAVYTLNVAQAGRYSVLLNYSEPVGTSAVNLLVNGAQQATVSFATTGSWSTYYNSAPTLVSLPAGQVTFKIQAVNAGFNLGGLQLQLTTQATSNPVSATGNSTIALQSFSSISGMSPESNGLPYDLGYINSGAYVVYPLTVAQAGTYLVTLNASSLNGGAAINVSVNGGSPSSLTLASTGSWSTYQNASAISVTLPAGAANLQIATSTGGFNLGGITLAPQTSLPSTAYYVSPSGSDSNNGRTPSTPFATLQHAANVVQPGYTVYAMAGTYQNADFSSSSPSQNVLTITTSGTQAAPITFTNYPGQSPKISFNGWYGIRVIAPASYIVLSGFEIQGDTQAVTQSYAQTASYGDPRTNGTGISVSGDPTGAAISTHITIQKMVIHDCPLNGIGAGFSDYLRIQDNVTYGNSYWSPYAGSGISVLGLITSDANVQSYKNFILRNVSYQNIEKIPNFQAYNWITDGNGIILDSFNHQTTSLPPYNGKTLVANNIVYSNGGTGISSYYSSNIDFVNNTSWSNDQNMTMPIGEVVPYYSSNINVINNIMVTSAGKPAYTAMNDTSVVTDYNLYFGGSGAQVIGTHDLVADPKFIAPQNGNFQLQSGSPALASGGLWSSVTTDFLGNTRPGSDGGVDRGAYQQ